MYLGIDFVGLKPEFILNKKSYQIWHVKKVCRYFLKRCAVKQRSAHFQGLSKPHASSL